MSKKTYCYIDDVIWLMRDLTRQRPTSMFDNSFLKMLKNAHDKYGLKVQLNLFFRTDFYYGNDEFTLTDMLDAYKMEWEENADWLHLGFHAKQEFPDYPYVNASYEDVKANFDDIKREVLRFASEKNWSKATVPHWRPISKEGVQALADSGIKLVNATVGERLDYDADPNLLFYGHPGRLLQNRKPETCIYGKQAYSGMIYSICSYNHLTKEQDHDSHTNLTYIKDEETGICFKNFAMGLAHNKGVLADVPDRLAPYMNNEYVGWGSHEQYFYPEYFGYQEDYEDKFYEFCKILKENDYEFIFVEDILE